MQKKLLFLTLNTFSSTGGIEKVCCIAGKALHEIMTESEGNFELFAMHDRPEHLLPKYIPQTTFRAFSGARLRFIKEAIITGRQSETVVLSHINLLLVGFLIKLLSPKTKLLLIAHGIEVWKPLPAWKRKILASVDLVLPVSGFTKHKMQALFNLKDGRLKVLNNCLDPFLQKSMDPTTVPDFKKRLGFSSKEIILFTLTRLKSTEQYKGYDKVIMALPAILKQHPNVRYLVAGKYDAAEKQRLDGLITGLGLQKVVVFAGFVPDKEIEAYFGAADIYIMPSTGEGFGIVFIEALFYGKPVIGGNIDGSVDALSNGQFGLLVDPSSNEEIVAAVLKVIKDKDPYIPQQPAVQSRFGYNTYKAAFKNILQ